MNDIKKVVFYNPIMTLVTLSLVAIVMLLLFHFGNTNKKFANLIERGFIIGYFFGIPHVTQSPFNQFHAKTYMFPPIPEGTAINKIIIIYVPIIIILLSRVNHFIKHSAVYLITCVLLGNPFLLTLHLITLLSTFWSDTPDVTIRASIILTITHSFSIYLGKFNWQELNFFMRWSGLAIAIMSLIKEPGKTQYLLGITYAKNAIAGIMTITAMLWLLYAINYPKKRNMALVCFIIAMMTMQFASSGGAKIVVILLSTLALSTSFLKKLPFQWAFTFVLVFFAFGTWVSIWAIDNWLNIIDSLGKDPTLTGRTIIWPQIIKAWMNKNPWLGFGYAGFWQSWRGINNPANNIMGRYWKPPNGHNGFVDVGADVGYLGLIFLALALLKNIAMAVEYLGTNNEPEAALPLVLITFVFMRNLTESSLLVPSFEWFYFCMTAVQLSKDTIGKRLGGMPELSDKINSRQGQVITE